MNDYISRESVETLLRDYALGCGNESETMYDALVDVLHEVRGLPAAEVKTLEKIGEEVDEALCILDEARDDGMDYGYYRDLHDSIAGIAVPDFGADGKEAE